MLRLLALLLVEDGHGHPQNEHVLEFLDARKVQKQTYLVDAIPMKSREGFACREHVVEVCRHIAYLWSLTLTIFPN